MQKVSPEYRKSMKSSLRERAYIKLSFGLVNQDAQENASVSDGEFAYYSNQKNIFNDRKDDTVYATFEENFTRVDGTMFHLPNPDSGSTSYYDTGLISRYFVSDGAYTVKIDLNVAEVSLKGLTVNFGENYPVDFDVKGSTGQLIEVRNNTQARWVTQEVMGSTASITMVFYRMKNLHSRLRIYSILFGLGLIYYNDSVIGSSLDSYVSPIAADVPQMDFAVQLKNYDHFFDIDNPNSAINFIETGQEMDISYGYWLPESEKIEWIKGQHLYCAEWETDDSTATIRCHDIFRSMDSEYYKGIFTGPGKSYYDLAVEVLNDAGITDFDLDSRLKNLHTKNPLPRVMHKEALQIIANACRCVLSQTRTGTIQIKSDILPQISSISADSHAPQSDLANTLNDTKKGEYAMFMTNYIPVDGGMYFYPYDREFKVKTGYVSQLQSNDEGVLWPTPKVTVVLNERQNVNAIKLSFGYTLPSKFVISAYRDESIEFQTVYADEITQTMVVYTNFRDIDKLAITFIRTKEPNSNIVLNYLSLDDITDFTMERSDMTAPPTVIKQELVKELIVPYYTYQKGTTQESLLSEDVVVTEGQIETYYVSEPSHDYEITLNGKKEGYVIISESSYFVTIAHTLPGSYKLELFGHRYQIIERYVHKSLNNKGQSIKWENPLISDIQMATDLADWLFDHYKSGIEYDYPIRGYPEIDVNDVVYQQNEFINKMKVNIYRYNMTFNQSFSGKVTARRIGG